MWHPHGADKRRRRQRNRRRSRITSFFARKILRLCQRPLSRGRGRVNVTCPGRPG
jgi:hypothetical protein